MRITKVVTRNGDKGQTNLAQGDLVSKNEPIINAIGDVDELNSVLGVCNSFCSNDAILKDIKTIQNDLFNIGGEISLNDSDKKLLKDESLLFLDNKIDEMNNLLEPLKEFILPGGDSFSSNLHLARSVARRAERSVVELYAGSLENNNIVKYLNRLSDYLFVLSRFYNKNNKKDEYMWEK